MFDPTDWLNISWNVGRAFSKWAVKDVVVLVGVLSLLAALIAVLVAWK